MIRGLAAKLVEMGVPLCALPELYWFTPAEIAPQNFDSTIKSKEREEFSLKVNLDVEIV